MSGQKPLPPKVELVSGVQFQGRWVCYQATCLHRELAPEALPRQLGGGLIHLPNAHSGPGLKHKFEELDFFNWPT